MSETDLEKSVIVYNMIWYIYAFIGILLRRQVFDVNEGNDDWKELIHPEDKRRIIHIRVPRRTVSMAASNCN